MTIGTAFVRGINPVWSFVDLNGLQFDDTFYMYVLENQIPYIPATVYHDDSGILPWTNPIQFLANGTLPIDIFWNDSVVYRLEFRQNLGLLPPSQNDPLIYLVENYIPTGSVVTSTSVSGSATENQITNGQFSLVNFVSPLVLTNVTNPPSIEIAPGWFLDLVGTGSVTIQQVPLNSGLNNPTNAPYALNINLNGGWTSLPVLRQRFYQNGMNWANKYLSTSFTGLISTGGAQVLIRLEASNGATLAVLSTSFLTTSFAQYNNFAFIAPYVNNDIPPDAYLDYSVYLPTTGNIFLTSFQLIASDTMGNIDYEQDTINRQIDHTFHYYKPKLEYKPIPSYLVGWDFPLNPAQASGYTFTSSSFNIGANKSQYTWDQTLVFQTVNQGVSVLRSAEGAFAITAAQTGQFAVIQYLDQPLATQILNDEISVNVAAQAIVAGSRGTVSLWYTTDTNLPNAAAGTNNSLVTALDANGHATCANGTWFEVPRGNLGNAQFTLQEGTNSVPFYDYNFSGWNLADETVANSATYFAIVIGFSQVTATDYIDIYSVGLCSGAIATRPAPKTQDQALRDCERYYEKSYDLRVLPETVTDVNALCKAQQGSVPTVGTANTSLQISSFDFEYRTLKRVSDPTLFVYSPVTGTVANVAGSNRGNTTPVVGDIPITSWTVTNGSKSSNCKAIQTNLFLTTPAINITTAGLCFITFHYVLDARLGIVN